MCTRAYVVGFTVPEVYIGNTTYNHHHTVQVAKFACEYISKCLVGTEKTPPVQVGVGGGCMVAKGTNGCTLVNALIGTRKTPLAQVAEILGNSKSRMHQPNAGSTRVNV